MDKLLNFIKEKYPQNANDISESLELLLNIWYLVFESLKSSFSLSPVCVVTTGYWVIWFISMAFLFLKKSEFYVALY